MEMTQIRYVLAASEKLNFTRAAESCDVSQPALTKGIKALEKELGSEIFHREGRRVILSEFGRTMVPQLRHILDEAEAARSLARSLRLLDKAPIRLGVISTLGHLRLARFLGDFDRSHKGLDLAVHEGGTEELLRQLEEDAIDVAILTGTEDIAARYRTQALYSERYVVVFPPGHPLGRRNAVALADLSGEDYVDRLSCEMREAVMAVCADNDVALYARFRSEREDWVQAMVLAGIGFAFMPEYSVSLPGLVQRPLTEPEVTRDVVAVTMPGRRYSPPVEALMRGMKGFAWPG